MTESKIEQTKRILLEDGWIKHDYERVNLETEETDGRCIAGALSLTAKIDAYEEEWVELPECDFIVDAIYELFPQRIDLSPIYEIDEEELSSAWIIPKFNDQDQTSESDIIAVLDRAIILEKEANK